MEVVSPGGRGGVGGGVGGGVRGGVRGGARGRSIVRVAGNCILCSNYPSSRSKKEEDGTEVGVMGSAQLLQNVVFSSQPISSFDWSPDKVRAWPVVAMFTIIIYYL